MKKKLNNKGFSLVELIIVIAIMAALVAILAPQYMKYVEKSRKQADANTAEEIFTACKIAATDENMPGFTATWNGSNLTISATTGTTASTAIAENLGKTAPDNVITIPRKSTVTVTNYVVVYTSGTNSSVTQSGGWWN